MYENINESLSENSIDKLLDKIIDVGYKNLTDKEKDMLNNPHKYDDEYFELDVYPFWNDKATLEIELLSEDQPFKLPPFIKLIREVSHEPEYRNIALAQRMVHNKGTD